MAAHPTGPPPALSANSTFQQDVDHWVYRLKSFMGNTSSLELEGSQSWSSSFFGCFTPIDTCLITCCCPCVTFGKTHHRLHKDKNLAGYSPVNASCLGFWASAYVCLTCVPLMLQRSEIRKRSQPHLTGDTVMDFAKAFCCGCCDLIQQDKEAEHLLANDSNQYVTEQPAAIKHDMSYASSTTQQPAIGAPTSAVGQEYHQQGYSQDQKVGL